MSANGWGIVCGRYKKPSTPRSPTWIRQASRVAEPETGAAVGAGIMGRGIAHAAALGGYHTVLEDLLPGALRKSEGEIRANLDKAGELGKVTAPDANAAFGRLHYAGSVEEGAGGGDLAV